MSAAGSMQDTVQPLGTEFTQNNIKECSSYLTDSTLRLHYKVHPVNAVLREAAVYCENHTEHTDTVRTSQEIHYVFATMNNRLILFGETVAVYC
jgi:hypothetical protein